MRPQPAGTGPWSRSLLLPTGPPRVSSLYPSWSFFLLIAGFVAAILVCAQREIDRLKKANDRLSRSNSTLRLQNKDWHTRVDDLEATVKERDALLASRAEAFSLLEPQNKDQEKEIKRLAIKEKALVEELMQVGHTAKGESFLPSSFLSRSGSRI